tara:strand:+ start:945 stop:1361 length:417 start_codon:yes stop_codon:yes gene_type:complete
MGVLNKLKGRMEGRNALTKGPGKTFEFEIDKDYSKDFNINGQKSNSYTSGVDAVSAGLQSGSSQPPIVDNSADTAEAMSQIGDAFVGAMGGDESKDPFEKRKKELDDLEADGMTRSEARKKRRKNNSELRKKKRLSKK